MSLKIEKDERMKSRRENKNLFETDMYLNLLAVFFDVKILYINNFSKYYCAFIFSSERMQHVFNIINAYILITSTYTLDILHRYITSQTVLTHVRNHVRFRQHAH